MQNCKFVLLLTGLAAVGVALADPVHHIGNTLLIKRANGTGRMLYRADHSFVLHAIGGDVVKGTWNVKEGRLCHVPVASKMAPFCVPDDAAHKVGDTWNVKSPDGIPEQLTLVAGQN